MALLRLPRALPAGYAVDFALASMAGKIIFAGLSFSRGVKMHRGVVLRGCGECAMMHLKKSSCPFCRGRGGG